MNFISLHCLGYYVRSQLEVHDVLCSVLGASQVCESLILPTSGLVNLVLRFSSSGVSLPVEESFRSVGKYHPKPRPPPGEVWVALYCLHPHRKNKAWIRTGGIPVLQRLLAKLGYRGLWVNLEAWDELSAEEKINFVKMITESSVGK